MLLPSKNFERRDGERVTRVFPVRLHSGPQEVLDSYALDVSGTGIRLVSPRALQDDALRLELELEPHLKLSFTGTPVWQQEMNRAGQHVVGLRFQGGRDEPHLRRWIKENSLA